MASVFDYVFNIGGNFSAQINGMSAATGAFSAQVDGAQNAVQSFTAACMTFDYAKNVAQSMAQGIAELSSAGIKLDSEMHDLSAVAGVTGDGLKQIETFARQSAKAFGTDASVAVEGYKLLLSQLTPELGKYPDALREMGDCIQTTSKLMGGDGVAAAQVLTTAMNQYGVSMEDPTAAAGEMARMMNVMAAAGQAGSAELPAISAALQQCGMAAKAANVSFEETNAAIQVLDKAGKKASEGGVALRNVLGQLSKGRFIDKQAREELEKVGIDVVALGDNSRSLKERLEMLKPMLNDSALLSKFFGVENANAARALIQGTEALQGFTDAVTGTNSATEQAAIVMDSYAERQARVHQQFESLKISIFQATGDLSLWTDTITSALVPLAQISPLLMGVGKATVALGFKIGAVCKGITVSISSIPVIGWIAALITAIGYLAYKFEWFRPILLGPFAPMAYYFKILWNNFYGLRVLIFTLAEVVKVVWSIFVNWISGVWDNLKDFCAGVWNGIRTISINIYNTVVNIIARIRAYFTEIKSFVADIVNAAITKFQTMYAPIYNVFVKISNGVKKVFGGIFDWFSESFSDFIGWLVKTYNQVAKALGWEQIKAKGIAAANASWNQDKTKNTDKNNSGSNKDDKNTQNTDISFPAIDPTGGSLSDASGTGSGNDNDTGGKIKNITINIEKLVERFEIHSTTVGESAEQVKAVILETLTGALNDTQLATS